MMNRVSSIIGPRKDKHLTHLHKLLSAIFPQGTIQGLPSGCSRGDLPDMLVDKIIGGIMPPGMIHGLGMEPSGDTQITLTPNGISIKTIRVMHNNKGAVNPEGMGLHALLGQDGFGDKHMLTGDDFPIHDNPLESLLSLLYAKAQETHVEPELMDGVVDGAKEDLGNEVTDKILAFIDSAKDGDIVVNDGDKKIHVKISSSDPADNMAVSEVTSKIASANGDIVALTSLEKKAALTAYNRHLITTKQLRKVGLTQTDLIDLRGTLDSMRTILDDNSDLEALSEAVRKKVSEDECVTLNDSALQGSLHDALTTVLNEDPESGTVHDMIYNTDLPSDKEQIIHIDGHPVDLTKLHSMTKREATSKYTPSLANYIYDEEKQTITVEKIKEFMKLIESVSTKDPDLAELFRSRLVVPLFADLEPDGDILNEDSLVDED